MTIFKKACGETRLTFSGTPFLDLNMEQDLPRWGGDRGGKPDQEVSAVIPTGTSQDETRKMCVHVLLQERWCNRMTKWTKLRWSRFVFFLFCFIFTRTSDWEWYLKCILSQWMFCWECVSNQSIWNNRTYNKLLDVKTVLCIVIIGMYKFEYKIF